MTQRTWAGTEATSGIATERITREPSGPGYLGAYGDALRRAGRDQTRLRAALDGLTHSTSGLVSVTSARYSTETRPTRQAGALPKRGASPRCFAPGSTSARSKLVPRDLPLSNGSLLVTSILTTNFVTSTSRTLGRRPVHRGAPFVLEYGSTVSFGGSTMAGGRASFTTRTTRLSLRST